METTGKGLALGHVGREAREGQEKAGKEIAAANTEDDSRE